MTWLRRRGSSVKTMDDSQPFIDVKQLIATLSEEELLASADDYFRGLTLDSEQCFKPFSTTSDAPQLARNLGLLLEAAELFPGADVIDFGCATGWLTIGLANLGCNAYGVDVSPTALRLAEAATERVISKQRRHPSFHVYQGGRLPFADGSVDRILCFDAFHHVSDQLATLREFSRVLRPGGRICMMEPGPHHSSTPQSQAEMRKYRVIENDVAIGEIATHCITLGLAAPQLLVQFPSPIRLGLSEFQLWAERGVPPVRGASLLQVLTAGMQNSQCITIMKGSPLVDSRNPQALKASLDAEVEKFASVPPGFAKLQFHVRNTGVAHWLTGDGRGTGVVKIGVQLISPATAAVVARDYHRVALPEGGIPPGAAVRLSAVIRIPAQSVAMQIDLVSEYIAWFSDLGACNTVRLDFPSASSENA